MRLYLILLLSVSICSFGISQNVERYKIEAEDAFAGKNYYASYYYITQYLENLDEADIDLEYFAAEAARHYKAFGFAAKHYARVVELERKGEFALASFWLGEMKMRMGQYDSAQVAFNQYLQEYEGENPYFTNLAKDRLESCAWSMDVGKNDKSSIYDIVRLGDGINSSFSEVAPILIEDRLYYSSLRFENPKDKHRPERPLSKVLYSEDRALGMLYEKLDDEDNHLHLGNLQYDEESKTIYYTKCQYLEGEEIHCDIFKRHYGDELGAETKVSGIGSDSITTTQPTIGRTPNGKDKALYFVSDRPGGKGKLDIWYVALGDDGEPSAAPINLMRLNTVGDEMSPFYHNASGSLFFSSDDYVGFGGQDIYRVNFDQFGKMSEPSNLGSPVNSSFDDIYFYVDEEETQAYFSSNRVESYYLDTAVEACCFDIYEVGIDNNIDLLALTFDETTRKALAQCEVTLLQDGNVIQTLTNLDSNDFNFSLVRNKSYMLIGNRDGYKGDTLMFDTKALPYGDTLVKELYLLKEDIYLDLCVFDAATRERLLGAAVTIRDVHTGEIIYSDILEEDNCDRIKVLPGHDYDISVSRDGYQSESIKLSVPEDAHEDIKQDVYLKRWTLHNVTPITVYFDNDIPDRRSRKQTSETTYSETFDAYVAKKPEYLDLVSKIYPDLQQDKARDFISEFFAIDVLPSKERLDQLIYILVDELASGKTVTFNFKGFASPRADSHYNDKLSSRRIKSVINEVRSYRDGLLVQYIDNGQLKIKETPYGESQAPLEVREKDSTGVPSIFGVGASRERKVEIDLISVE